MTAILCLSKHMQGKANRTYARMPDDQMEKPIIR